MHAPTLGRGFALACLFSTLGLSGSTSAEPQSIPSQSVGVTKATPAQATRLGSSQLPAPGNDSCLNPVTIPSSGGVVQFSTIDATPDASQGQVTPCPGAGARSVWFSWTAPRLPAGVAGTVTIETCGPPTTIDTTLAVYTTASPCPGTTAPFICNNDACGTQSSVTFPYTPGQLYTIQITTPIAIAGGTGQLSVCVSRNRSAPGSLLVYPEWDNTSGLKTLYTITHAVVDPAAHMRSVIVEVVYIRKSTCGEVNFTLNLTPYDTVSHITKLQNPNIDQGFLYAFAKECMSPAVDNTCPIVFNSLIGMETVINGIESFDYSINAISFQGLGAENSPNDDGIRTGIRELDDVNEYVGVPSKILIPRFLGQDDAGVVSNNINSDIILLSLSARTPISLGGSVNSTNGTIQTCSSLSGVTFTCWDRRPLRDLSPFTLNSFLSGFTNNELRGLPAVRTGSIVLEGDSAFYAVLVEKAGAGNPQSAADLPFELCSRGDGRLRPIQ